MADTPEFLVQCVTAEEADRALGRGFAIETSPEVASECGAPAPGESELGDPVEDALEAHLHPYGDGEPPADGTTGGDR